MRFKIWIDASRADAQVALKSGAEVRGRYVGLTVGSWSYISSMNGSRYDEYQVRREVVTSDEVTRLTRELEVSRAARRCVEDERDAALKELENAGDWRDRLGLAESIAIQWEAVAKAAIARAEAAERGLEQVLGPTREGETTLVHWIKTFKARAEAAIARAEAAEELLDAERVQKLRTDMHHAAIDERDALCKACDDLNAEHAAYVAADQAEWDDLRAKLKATEERLDAFIVAAEAARGMLDTGSEAAYKLQDAIAAARRKT